MQDGGTPLSLESGAICDCMSVISFNMHGYNQGSHTVRDLMLSMKPDVFLLQEHWLTPMKLSGFDNVFSQYNVFWFLSDVVMCRKWCVTGQAVWRSNDLSE